MKSKIFKHAYIRNMDRAQQDHVFWGVKMEVLFRGFSHEDMFRIENRIRELICREKAEIAASGKLREITIEQLDTLAFKDEVI